jgi:hypothetical protein
MSPVVQHLGNTVASHSRPSSLSLTSSGLSCDSAHFPVFFKSFEPIGLRVKRRKNNVDAMEEFATIEEAH